MKDTIKKQIKRILYLDNKGALTNKEAKELEKLLDVFDIDYIKSIAQNY